MLTATILRLNTLNREFYQRYAHEFDASRQYYWDGWYQLRDTLSLTAETGPRTFLDIGCGNGRFSHFLQEKCSLERVQYYGVDYAPDLLSRATSLTPPYSSKYVEIDIISALMSDPPTLHIQIHDQIGIDHPQFDLITLFGVFHHVPNFELRHKLLTTLSTMLSENGTLCMTTWNFLENKSWKKKIIDPVIAGITTSELEMGDYILDWHRGGVGYRYVHAFSTLEIAKMIPSNLRVVSTFLADGQDNQGNHYFILGKK